ncbi:MAG: GUN4 domain-containing protein [Cyanobacteria bacterium P01_A01_bin.17]
MSLKSPHPERRYIQKFVQALIQWMPLGSSGWLFASFLLEQEWLQALLIFPVTVVTAVWAAYSQNFVGRLQEIYSERGKRDADSLVNWLDRLDRALRWQLSGFDGKYLKRLANDCLYSSVEGYRQPDDIKMPLLEEVFVPLQLSSDFSKTPTGDVVSFQMGTYNEDVEEVLAQQIEQEELTIWKILAQGRKDPRSRSITIQAWGGFGKTTLLKHLAFVYARSPFKLRLHRVSKNVPVLMRLRKWKEQLSKDTPPDLPTLIEKHYLSTLAGGQPLTPPENWARNLLQRGNMLVLLDGFDEVAEQQRPAISEWITQQIKNYSKSTFILTSRPSGYKQYTAERPKTNLVVKPFNSDQRNDFIEKWYACQERYGRSQSKRNASAVDAIALQKSDDLIKQINRREELKNMATNPLLLNMIATFHRFYPGSELPRKRAELYQEICRLQLGDRPRARRIDMLLSADASQAVLQGIALAMTQQSLQIIPHDELLALIQTHLAPIDNELNPSNLLKKIVRVSELLVEHEPREYQFAHLSFQEYLAATQIKKLKQENLLVEHNEAWRGTVLLYAAQVTPTSLIEGLCQIGTPKALKLAYDSWFENPGKVPSQTFDDLQDLSYALLEHYLKEGQWKEADLQTYQLMIQVLKKEQGDFLLPNELLNFPCKDLHCLNDLWLKYSNGHFGFSVQKEIYVECGGVLDGKFHKEAWYKFCEKSGWMKEEKYIFLQKKEDGTFLGWEAMDYSLDSQKGHLPWVVNGVMGGWGGRDFLWVAGDSLLSDRDL